MPRRNQALNGTVWLAKWPLCHLVIVQWIEADKWLLLSDPEHSAHGGTCMLAMSHGPVIKTHEQIAALLDKWEATLQPNMMLLPLNASASIRVE